MNSSPDDGRAEIMARNLAQMEARLARIEQHLGLAPLAEEDSSAPLLTESPPLEVPPDSGDEFEFEVGQNWFAKIGIVVLAVGLGFTLSQPLPGLPAAVPSLLGYGLSAALFLFARWWRDSFKLVSRYFRAAGMALLYFATVRLFFFGTEPVLNTNSFLGRTLLLAVIAVNLLIGIRRESPYLVTLGLVTGFVTTVLVGSTWFVLGSILALCIVIAWTRVRYEWPALLLIGTPLVYASYTIWAINNPVLGNELQLVTNPYAAVWLIPLYGTVLAAGSLLRHDRSAEDPPTAVAAVLNCGGYAVFLLHTLIAQVSVFTASHTVIALVYILLGVAFWLHERSRVSTFFYAMTGYAALSAAIIKAVPVPEVFVWLSLQSVLVATTAIWFRSRFIVVANFLIFVGIISGYLLLSERESGISIGFGVVALVTARILNWQKHRLELKTELMRNAYLVSAFTMFPYALYHLVPDAFVSLSWGGMAIVYYLCNLVIRNRKYRWMGHGTLVLAVLHVIIVGIGRLDPVYRSISFLGLGSVLLVVSLIFAKVRARQRARETHEAGP